MKRAALFIAAVAAYMVAAWSVAPGFYDGFSPPQPYNWTCPPPQAGANLQPKSGHLDIKVIGGVSDANSAFTDDGQVVIGFLPGAFDPQGKTTISVDILPLPTCPQPPGIRFVTNVYHMTASAPLVKDANLVLRYSNLEPDPGNVYLATDPSGPWNSIGAQSQSQAYTIVTKTRSFGYFGAGYSSTSAASAAGLRVGGGQVLPIVVAILIVVVILAGLPLAVLRRRKAGGEVEEKGDV